MSEKHLIRFRGLFMGLKKYVIEPLPGAVIGAVIGTILGLFLYFWQVGHQSELDRKKMTIRWINAVIIEIDHNQQKWVESSLIVQSQSDTYFYRELRNDAMNVFLNLHSDLAIDDFSIIDSVWGLMELTNAINQFIETMNIHKPISSSFNLGNIAFIAEETVKISKPKYIEKSNSVKQELTFIRDSLE